jgi:diguanylate cyclase (GGDEF)-like protein
MPQAIKNFTPRVFWTAALTATVVLVAMVAIPQCLSQQVRLDGLRSHVGQVARLAASVIDGDLHRRLIDAANYTPELYERTLDPLVKFHAADPNIFHIYTMVERGGQSFFVVDTAASSKLSSQHSLRASAYMEPFATLTKEPDADWLKRIAAGETYVYPRFVRDEYGYFLSGHAPILDSQGRYSGFVGIDIDLQDYLEREAKFQTISIGTLLAAVLLALMIGYLAARYHYAQNHRMQEHYQLSIHDELTKLLNRRGGMKAVNSALARHSASYAAILVDVDDLKGINDGDGHAAGDAFLIKVADTMRASVRDTDICARLGGDEFLIFASACGLDSATEMARRILSEVSASDGAPGRSHVGVSIGICIATPPHVDFETMYRCADLALYRAKSAGRNRFVIYEPTAELT